MSTTFVSGDEWISIIHKIVSFIVYISALVSQFQLLIGRPVACDESEH